MERWIDIDAYRYVDFVQGVMRGAATIDDTLLENLPK
jgi:hypothetical protein